MNLFIFPFFGSSGDRKSGGALLWIAGAALLLSTGCAGFRNDVTLEPVGPEPIGVVAPPNNTNGTLLVYSAYDSNADFNGDDYSSVRYTDFHVFTSEGQLVRSVRNNTSTFNPEPVPVSLPPGKYQIKARANGYGEVTVPILIASHRLTVLDPEGDNTWSRSVGPATGLVALPDGTAVGWRAE